MIKVRAFVAAMHFHGDVHQLWEALQRSLVVVGGVRLMRHQAQDAAVLRPPYPPQAALAYLLARRYAADQRFAFGTWKIEVLAGR